MRAVAAFGLVAALKEATTVSKYGPNDCVELSQSKTGTCIISTNCKAQDIAKFEFAFTCTTTNHEVQKHSFGLGGFDPVETYDTEVQCKTCGPPPEAAPIAAAVKKRKPAKVAPHKPEGQKKEKAKKEKAPKKKGAITKHITNLHTRFGVKAEDKAPEAEENKDEDVKAKEDTAEEKGDDVDWQKLVISDSKVETGPSNCVSIFRKKESSTCVIHTECEKEKMDSYEFGLDCIDKNNMQVRHLFGRDSFLSNEWFDTLIKCEQCLAILYSDADTTQMDARVDSLEKSVNQLQKAMTTLEAKVDKVAKEEAPENQEQADESKNKQFLVKGQTEVDDNEDEENEDKAAGTTKSALEYEGENEDDDDESDAQRSNQETK